eukprot:3821710-Pleurochrysis_carterae.AAC.8
MSSSYRIAPHEDVTMVAYFTDYCTAQSIAAIAHVLGTMYCTYSRIRFHRADFRVSTRLSSPCLEFGPSPGPIFHVWYSSTMSLPSSPWAF